MVFDISSLFYLPLRLLLFWFLKMPKTTLLLRHLLFKTFAIQDICFSDICYSDICSSVLQSLFWSLYMLFSCKMHQTMFFWVTRNKHENINVDYKIIEVITSKHKPRTNKNVETKKCRITKMSNTKMSKINLQVPYWVILWPFFCVSFTLWCLPYKILTFKKYVFTWSRHDLTLWTLWL